MPWIPPCPWAALLMALRQRKPEPGLIHRSDRGCQYASEAYRHTLAAHGLQASMSRKANCYDNAMRESFWSSLKNELVHRSHFATRAQARTAIFDYIEGFFSALGYKSPSTTNPLSVNPQPSLPPAVRIIGASSKIWIETLLRTCPKFI